jgi:hypothetical protein
MRKIKVIQLASVIVFSAILLLLSCSNNGTRRSVKKDGENPQRIIGKESTVYDFYRYQIIEVDGVEYIATCQGGIYPLVKDK